MSLEQKTVPLYNSHDLVIYHGGCPDGTAAAWCFWNLMDRDKNKFYYGNDRSNPPDVINSKLVFVDFVYPKQVMLSLLEKGNYITVLDHHKTSKEILDIDHSNLTVYLDMDRSGAQIAWEYVYRNIDYPWYINDIADRDLWIWKFENSKYSTAAMFEDRFYVSINDFDTKIKTADRQKMIDAIKPIVDYKETEIKNKCKEAVFMQLTSVKTPEQKWKVWLLEADHKMASLAGNMLSEDVHCDFAAVWRAEVVKKEFYISLRASKESSIDLTEVSKHFDEGGGHKKASGITLFDGLDQSIFESFTSIEHPLGIDAKKFLN
jgi:oligoribonuclease NrnB/cAMP/cGMP phosphodiesterase (DHH superfamily)